MANEDLVRSEIKDILLKEYEVMRTEVRMYINKYYLALTVILALLTAGIFKTDPSDNQHAIYLWTPFVFASLIGFMAMINFFVNKTAGYIRLIEYRLNSLYGTSTPVDNMQPIRETKKLGLLFWESYYADKEMDRDKGDQLKSTFCSPIVAMVLPGLAILGYIILSYYSYLADSNIYAGAIYLFCSIFLIGLSFISLKYINTKTRNRVNEINEILIKNYKISLLGDNNEE